MLFFSTTQLAVSAMMMFVGSTVLSTVGFGIGMTTTPVLLLVLDPQTVVVTVNTVSLALFVMIIFQTRNHLPVREMIPVSVGGLAGVPVGVLILSSAGAGVLRISITVLILLLTAAVVFGVRSTLPRSRLIGPLLGFVVGVMLTALGIGGPLMALFLLTRDLTRHAVRASLSFYFLVVEFSGAVGYGVAGLFTPERITLILIVVVPVLLGFGLATVLVQHMNERRFQNSVVVVIITTSLMVLGRELTRL